MEMVLIFTFCLILAGTDAVTTETGYRGRSVQIKCPYTSGYEKNNKYLCRGNCLVPGFKDIPVESKSPAKDSRFSLYDDTTAKVFTVTITDLRPEDEGTYWCVIDQTGRDIYTEIILLVKTDPPPISTVSHTTHTTHTTLTHSMSTSVRAENTHSTTVNLLNDATHPTTTPSSQDFPMSTIIIAVSVVLALLLIVLLFTLALQRKNKTRASSPAQPAQSSSNHNVVPHPDCVYEEIKDNISLTNTLYSTALTPTNPSEIYSDPELPTIHSDSSVSAAPPSGVKSGESLTYAAVSFNTDSTAVIYNHESNLCEYATVNDTKCG
ncbi:CMRF35-like molecule 3 [Clarias gariepinus]|uniref:CMRF35-like molecule 3 n=1 Tax=Clarias gariepinus TaxID=13013 RepID=UPI00234DB25D|nr:CMRF35-like molecule 3 [Clarias gariepinus]